MEYDILCGGFFAIFLRIFEFLAVFYGVASTLWIVILTNEPFIEKIKSLETAEALFYNVALHFIFAMWPRQFFDMIDIINKKIRERELNNS